MYVSTYVFVLSSLSPWHLSVFSFSPNACSSQGNTDYLKTLTSSFSRSTVLLYFFPMTTSHLSLLAKAPATVFSIKPCFCSFSSSLLSLKDLFNAIFQFQITIATVQCVQRATTQEVLF